MNLLSQLAASPWADRIGWTLVHSLWQVAAIAAAFAVLLAVLRNRSANARYLCGCLALSAMIIAPVATLFSLRAPLDDSATAALSGAPSGSVALPAPVPANMIGQPLLAAESLQNANAAASPESTPTPSELRRGVAAAQASAPRWGAWRARLQPALPTITAAWFAGVAALLMRPAIGLLAVRRLRSQGLSPLADDVRRVGARLAQQLHVRGAVEFAESTLVSVPTVVGYLRPLVLLPATAVTGLSREELELILAHELAHIRRHDYLVNFCQTLIEALLFYHPAMWWVSMQVRRERENCCDDVAVALCGNRPTYIRALWAMENQRASALPALAASGGSLVARVRRLVPDRPTTPLVGGAGAWFGLALIVALGAGTAIVAMGSQNDPQPAPAAAPLQVAAPAQTAATPQVAAPAQDAASKQGAATAEVASAQVAAPTRAAVSAVAAVSPAETTSLTGRILYDGPAPTPKQIELPLGRADADRYRNLKLTDESLIVGPEGGLANVVIWVRSTNVPVAPRSGPSVTVRAKDLRIQPHVLAVQRNQPLTFVNEESFGTNLKFGSENFLLGPGETRIVTNPRAVSLPETVADSVRPSYLSYILTLPHSYYSITSPNGRFEIANLPLGEWEFAIWHERANWLSTDKLGAGRFTLKIEQGKNDLGDLRVDPNVLRRADDTTVRSVAAGAPQAQPDVSLPRGPADGPPRPAPTVRGVVDNTIKALAFSRDGRYLAGGSGDQTVKIWDASDRGAPAALTGHTGAVAAVHFTADGKSLLSVGNEIKRWSVADWQLVETVKLDAWQRPSAIRFSPDGRRLSLVAMQSANDIAIQYAVQSSNVAAAEYRQAFFALEQKSPEISAADVEKAKQAWEDSKAKVDELRKLRLTSRLLTYDTASGLLIDESTLDGLVLSLEYSPDGKILAAGSISSLGPDAEYRGSIRLFDAASGRQRREIAVFPASASALAFSPDGSKLCYSGVQKVVMLNLSDDKVIQEFPGHTAGIAAIAFSPDGKLLVSGGEGPGLRMPNQWMLMSETKLWDVESGRMLWGNVGELGQVLSIAFSPDGSRFARSDGRTVLVQTWPETGRSWVQYNAEGEGLGDQLSAARRGGRSTRPRVESAADGEVQPNNPILAAEIHAALLETVAKVFRMKTGAFPSALRDVITRPADPQLAERWGGPYLREDLATIVDPWGNEYRFAIRGGGQPESFDVWSVGPDGQDGSADDIGKQSGEARTFDRNVEAVRAQINLLSSAINIYQAVQNTLPLVLDDLHTRPITIEPNRWVGPFVHPEKKLVDPWGNAFKYRVPGVRNPESFDVWSTGADGQDGTADDIGNWPVAAAGRTP